MDWGSDAERERDTLSRIRILGSILPAHELSGWGRESDGGEDEIVLAELEAYRRECKTAKDGPYAERRRLTKQGYWRRNREKYLARLRDYYRRSVSDPEARERYNERQRENYHRRREAQKREAVG